MKFSEVSQNKPSVLNEYFISPEHADRLCDVIEEQIKQGHLDITALQPLPIFTREDSRFKGTFHLSPANEPGQDEQRIARVLGSLFPEQMGHIGCKSRKIDLATFVKDVYAMGGRDAFIAQMFPTNTPAP